MTTTVTKTPPAPQPIRGEFASRPISAEGLAQCDQVREILSTALTELEKRVPPGVYRTRIAERLEEAGMLAIKAISYKPEVQG